MDEINITSCVQMLDVCRCCLSRSGTRDLTTAYTTDTGSKEVYVNLLKDCFGVTLSCMNEMEVSNSLCEECVLQLHSASIFREQVLHADTLFSHYWTSRMGNTSNPQLKSYKKLSKVTEKKCELKDKDIDYDIDSDSDTPLATLKYRVPMIEDFLEDDYLIEEANEDTLQKAECEAEIDMTEPEEKLEKSSKLLSERRRIILTCSVVLLETTACPFRHYRSWFRCFFCTDDFMDINTLRNHYFQKHLDVEAELKKIKRYPRSLQIEISNLKCRLCCTLLTNLDKMADHFIEKHQKMLYKECIADYKVNSSPYTCHLCKKEFHVFRMLTIHLNEHYANCVCHICGKSFLNSKRLKVHTSTHQNGVYPCIVCNKILKTKSSQLNHMESAHLKRVIKCHICLKPMKHYNDRVKHMSLVHNITHTFKCPLCDRQFNIKHYLATHIRQTHGHKNKTCSICNMGFVTQHSLKKHMLKHSGDRPYSCAVCSKGFARSYTLKEHMKSHGDAKLLLMTQ